MSFLHSGALCLEEELRCCDGNDGSDGNFPRGVFPVIPVTCRHCFYPSMRSSVMQRVLPVRLKR